MRVGSLVVVVVGLAVVSESALAGGSPAGMAAASIAVGKAQGSVHYVARARIGVVSVTIVGDAALDRGRQQITYTKAGQSGHATTLVVNNTAYITGDAFTLANYMQLPATLANRWLSVAHTAPGFNAVAVAVRLGSALDELRMTALRFGPARAIGGTRAVAIQGRQTQSGVSANVTLYVRASGAPLPVQEVASEGSGARDVITFSRWKEAVTVTAPSGATPIH